MESEKKYSGNWESYKKNWQEGSSVYYAPAVVNLFVLDWFQLFLTVWGANLMKIQTLSELEFFFHKIYIPYLFHLFKDSYPLQHFLNWEQVIYGVPYGADFYRVRYENLLQWTRYVKNTPMEKTFFYIHIHEITWNACLSLFKNQNGDFPHAILCSENGFINWLVEIDPYESIDIQRSE